MSSRDKILNEISRNKPQECPMPESFQGTFQPASLAAHFMEVLQNIGGKSKKVTGWHEPLFDLQQQVQSGLEVVNTIERLAPYHLEAYREKGAEEIESVHTVYLKGAVAVAENASIWISEKSMGNRLLPFLCQHLVIVVEEKDLVANMHEAYDKINVDEDGYGVFIAGPSKTADIEQSLVIGAHGPISLQVFILSGIAE